VVTKLLKQIEDGRTVEPTAVGDPLKQLELYLPPDRMAALAREARLGVEETRRSHATTEEAALGLESLADHSWQQPASARQYPQFLMPAVRGLHVLESLEALVLVT